MKDVVFDMEGRPRRLTLLRFHFRRTLHYPRILAVAFWSSAINLSRNGPQIRNISGVIPQTRQFLDSRLRCETVAAVAAGRSAQPEESERWTSPGRFSSDLLSEKWQPARCRGLIWRSGRTDLAPLCLLICPLWLCLLRAVAHIRAHHLTHSISCTVAAENDSGSTHQEHDESDKKNGS